MFLKIEGKDEAGWHLLGIGDASNLHKALTDVDVMLRGTRFEDVDNSRIRAVSEDEADHLRKSLAPNTPLCPCCGIPLLSSNFNGERILTCETCEKVYTMTFMCGMGRAA